MAPDKPTQMIVVFAIHFILMVKLLMQLMQIGILKKDAKIALVYH
jgi:hypothetical protein